ncbi:MAG TPA: hypothetical protein VIY08_15080 [Candidatus Nitrosocosmicus sp.]
MSQIEIDCNCNNSIDKKCSFTTTSRFADVYPALQIRQLGIDKNFKGQGLGYYIILYCLGLGQILGQSVGYGFLLIRTTKKLAEKYYGPKYNFKWERGSDLETVGIYRKLY